MLKFIRLQEYKVMIYRLLLVYFFYTVSRFLFFIYNYSYLEIDSISEYLRLENIDPHVAIVLFSSMRCMNS